MSEYEIFSIICVAIGFIWWLAAMYWQLHQAVETLREIKDDMHGHGKVLDNHEGRIIRLESTQPQLNSL
jgi:hypothetical protein